jgi:DNA repair exonuclease SbcCD nuclease subunit
MILLFGDIHIDLYRQYSYTLPDGRNSRLAEQEKVIDKVCEVADEYQADRIVFMGDLFNQLGETLPKVIYDAAYRIVDKLRQHTKCVWLIVGNHDIHRGINLFEPFKSMSGVAVVDTVKEVVFDSYRVVMVPWGQPLPPIKADLLLGHVPVMGAKTGLGFSLTEGVAVSSFQTYTMSLLGHIHKRQMWGSAMYLGSVMQNNHGDAGEDKGVYLLKDSFMMKFVPIDSPQFRTLPLVGSQEDCDIMLENIQDSPRAYFQVVVKERGIVLPDFGPNVTVKYELAEEPVRLEQKTTEPIEVTVENFIKESNTIIDKDEAIKVAKELLCST